MARVFDQGTGNQGAAKGLRRLLYGDRAAQPLDEAFTGADPKSGGPPPGIAQAKCQYRDEEPNKLREHGVNVP